MKRKYVYYSIVLTICCLILVLCIPCMQENTIEREIVNAANHRLPEEGMCVIDLAEVFSEFEWDTVSVFVGGNSKQVEAALGVKADVCDGLVFSLDGNPVAIAMSAYQFPTDTPQKLLTQLFVKI